MVIHTLYQQQQHMYESRTHRVEERIVSIHPGGEPQLHIRPIVRGKAKAGTEFGAKINTSLIDGYTSLDKLCWGAFNEGSHL
jgi:IS5 family transposase